MCLHKEELEPMEHPEQIEAYTVKGNSIQQDHVPSTRRSKKQRISRDILERKIENSDNSRIDSEESKDSRRGKKLRISRSIRIRKIIA